jgi:hypothetical protein
MRAMHSKIPANGTPHTAVSRAPSKSAAKAALGAPKKHKVRAIKSQGENTDFISHHLLQSIQANIKRHAIRDWA